MGEWQHEHACIALARGGGTGPCPLLTCYGRVGAAEGGVEAHAQQQRRNRLQWAPNLQDNGGGAEVDLEGRVDALAIAFHVGWHPVWSFAVCPRAHGSGAHAHRKHRLQGADDCQAALRAAQPGHSEVGVQTGGSERTTTKNNNQKLAAVAASQAADS